MRRATFAAAILAIGLATAVPTHAQSPDLASLVLTQAEVPSGLQLNSGRSGSETRGGIAGYRATFETGGIPSPGAIVSVASLVTLPSDPAAGLDELMGSMRQGMPGSPTDQASPPVGDDSRAFTNVASMGPLSVSMAAAGFRRNGVVGAVMVVAADGQPRLDDAIRLAQVMDGRVAAATAQ
jgi:hypothetical protein